MPAERAGREEESAMQLDLWDEMMAMERRLDDLWFRGIHDDGEHGHRRRGGRTPNPKAGRPERRADAA